MTTRPRRLGMAQRVALLIAAAGALLALGRYLEELGGSPADFGWFGYAPLTDRIPSVSVGLAPWAQLLIWVGLLAVWTLVALWLLRPSAAAKPAESSVPPPA